jgi:hypothetical protein
MTTWYVKNLLLGHKSLIRVMPRPPLAYMMQTLYEIIIVSCSSEHTFSLRSYLCH